MHHGTADLSILVGDNDVGSNPLLGSGISGAVPAAQAFFIPVQSAEAGPHVPQAILLAASLLSPGDVVLMAIGWVSISGVSLPITWDPAVQNAVAVAEALGIHVVYAAGNGGSDLDALGIAPVFGTMVGAVDVQTGARESFSNYSRAIPFCAQGSEVVAAGYGDLIYTNPLPGPQEQYTAVYSGTSSASAITAGVFASLADAWRSSLVSGALSIPPAGAPLGWPIDPASMRSAATQYAPGGGAGNQLIGQYVNALRTLRRLGIVRNGTGSTTACSGPNCLQPLLSNSWVCGGVRQWSEPQIGNSSFTLRISNVPTSPGTFTSLFWSLLPANVNYPGLPGPVYVDLATLALSSPLVQPTVGCSAACSSPSFCGEAFIPLSIPNIPTLAGFSAWGQAATIGPGGYTSLTNGVKMTLFP